MSSPSRHRAPKWSSWGLRSLPLPERDRPSVYDIHSPRAPTREEIVGLLARAIKVIPVGRLWVNPDCGLKRAAGPRSKPRSAIWSPPPASCA
ncbi:hypothetical protein [Pendulispora albinea]|uniref:hypothetical protein n=1 Tax=Pendulispora albinea TaxID=2741071 RepID=UPI00374E13A1